MATRTGVMLLTAATVSAALLTTAPVQAAIGAAQPHAIVADVAHSTDITASQTR